MEIEHVRQILQTEGLGPPNLNALIPNVANYRVLLMQPRGVIEATGDGVRNSDRDLARAQFESFLSKALQTQADLAVTPEYAMPWEVLSDDIKKGRAPAPGQLWAFGCESIKYAELSKVKAELAPHASVLHEPLDGDPERFLDPLAYVFVAPVLENQAETKLVILVQFKTHPMADKDHFEVNGLECGTRIYQFGGSDGQEIRLISLICSDALAFFDAQALAVHDRALVLHIQLNANPRHEQFRRYRDKLLQYQGDATEIICLNWAGSVRLLSAGKECNWQNIAGSAWYLKPDKFDCRDQTLGENHKRGLYYTWLKTVKVHALFFNYGPAIFFLYATKVAHVGVPAVSSRRRGPKLTKTYVWDEIAAAWTEQADAQDGFDAIVNEAGDAATEIKRISDQNPFAAERVLALCAGKIAETDNWHMVHQLDSCQIGESEIIFRLTFCQDTDQSARDFRIARLRRCRNLWDILQSGDEMPPALEDFKSGFQLNWSRDFPHQNAISDEGKRATVVYMGEEVSLVQVETTATRIAEFLHRKFSDPDDSLEAQQRLTVWYRVSNAQIASYGVHKYSMIDKTEVQSAVGIGRSG